MKSIEKQLALNCKMCSGSFANDAYNLAAGTDSMPAGKAIKDATIMEPVASDSYTVLGYSISKKQAKNIAITALIAGGIIYVIK